MVLDFSLAITVWSRVLIFRILFNNLVDPFIIKDTYLEITNMLLEVPLTLMIIYIRATQNFNFLDPRRLLCLILLPSAMSLGDTIHMISYQIIGATVTFGKFSSHCYYGWGILWSC